MPAPRLAEIPGRKAITAMLNDEKGGRKFRRSSGNAGLAPEAMKIHGS